jgi:hypothetical protein
MKFIVTEVSEQNYKLSVLRMEIDRIEDAEMLKKQKKELLRWYFPKADSFLIFFQLLPSYVHEICNLRSARKRRKKSRVEFSAMQGRGAKFFEQ